MNNSFLNNRFVRFFLFSLILIPVSVYLWAMFRFSVNVPFFDDFEWSFEFLDNYQRAGDFVEKLRLILSPHNEHRMLMTRLTVILLTAFDQALNLRYMAWIGNLYVLGVFVILWRYLRFSETNTLWLLPLAFIWLQLQYFQNIVTTYSVPNNSVIFFAFATVLTFCYSLGKTTHAYFILTLILAIITTLCNGNGIVMLPIICVLYFISGNHRRALIATIILTLAATIHLYFLPLDGNKVTFSLKTLLFFVDILSVAAFPDKLVISQIAGVIFFVVGCVITLIWIVRSFTGKISTARLFLIGVYGFLVGTAVVTAIMRASYNLPPAPWYKGYSLLFFGVSFLIIAEFVKTSTAKLFIYALAIGFSFTSFFVSAFQIIPHFNSFNNSSVADGINFANNRKWAFIPIQANNDNYRDFNAVTNRLIENEDYILPPVPAQLLSLDDKINFQEQVDVVQEYDSFEKATNIIYTPSQPLQKYVYGFILNPITNDLVIYGVYQPLNGKKNILRGENLFLTVYSFSVKREFFSDNMPAGRYTTGFITFSDQHEAIWLKSNVEVEIVNI